MNVERISKTQIKILLSESEMKQMGLSLENLDCTAPHTRRLLMSLLEESREESGFEFYGHRLLIEIYPQDGGGCAIYYKATLPTGSERFLKNSVYGPVLFTFVDIDSVIEASCRLFCRYCHRIYKSSLYRLQGSYRLIIYPLDRVDSLTVSFLSEFAEKSGEGSIAAAFVEEHGQAIVLDNAIDTFSDYFSEFDTASCASALSWRILLP